MKLYPLLHNVQGSENRFFPIPLPRKLDLRIPAGFRLLHIHSHGGTPHYICGDNEGSYAVMEENGEWKSLSGKGCAARMTGVASMGNVVTISGKEGMDHIFLREGNYRLIPGDLPRIRMDFGMTRVTPASSSDAHFSVKSHLSNFRQIFPSGTPGGNSSTGIRDKDMYTAAVEELTDHVYGLLNKFVAEEVRKKGRWHQPFYLRYALRLYDGSYCSHSAPLLMTPRCVSPWIPFLLEPDGNDASVTSDTSRLECFRIDYRLLPEELEKLKNWEGIVAGIDIFASEEIPLYDQSGDVEGSTTLSLASHRPTAIDTDPYLGCWRENPDAFADTFRDHYLSEVADGAVYVWKLPENSFFRHSLESEASFYRIARLDFASLTSSEEFSPLKLEDDNLTLLRQFPLLPDDYQSRFTFRNMCLWEYCGRLFAGGGSVVPPNSFGDGECRSFADGREVCAVRVYMHKDGELIVAQGNGTFRPSSSPIHLFYPDPDAFLMEVVTGDADPQYYPLRRHSLLRGAVWLSPLFGESTAAAQEISVPSGEGFSEMPQDNIVRCSCSGNPFLFPPEGVAMAAQGRVTGMDSVAAALSEGQFGEYPLFVFTDRGVWTMALDEEALPARMRFVRSDVVGSHAQIEDFVAAVNDAGEVAAIKGMGKEVLNAPFLDGMMSAYCRRLPLWQEFSGLAQGEESWPDKDFVREATLLADRVHNRLVMVHPAFPYSWCFSLRYGCWYRINDTSVYALGSHPYIVGVDSEGNLRSYSRESETPEEFMVVKEVAPEGNKGGLRKIEVMGDEEIPGLQMALWGSRDEGRHWVPVTGVRGSSIRHLSGTRYPRYLCALKGEMINSNFIIK